MNQPRTGFPIVGILHTLALHLLMFSGRAFTFVVDNQLEVFSVSKKSVATRTHENTIDIRQHGIRPRSPLVTCNRDVTQADQAQNAA